MQFNVADLLKDRIGAAREYQITDEPVRIDGSERRLSGEVRFDRTREGLLVRVALRGGTSCECSRCLTPVAVEIPLRFEEEYIPTVDILTGTRVTAPDREEEAYRITERHVVDLAESLAQYWMMAIPMAPLCSDACEGLCPDCGSRMTASHACEPRHEDARWSKLRDLKFG